MPILDLNESLIEQALLNTVCEGYVTSAIALKVIFDHKMLMGAATQEEYIDNFLPFSKRTAYRQLEVADELVKAFKIDLEVYVTQLKKISTESLLELIRAKKGNEQKSVTCDTNELAQKVLALGLYKLLTILKNYPRGVQFLAETGELYSFKFKRCLSLDEIAKMTNKELVDASKETIVVELPDGEVVTLRPLQRNNYSEFLEALEIEKERIADLLSEAKEEDVDELLAIQNAFNHVYDSFKKFYEKYQSTETAKGA